MFIIMNSKKNWLFILGGVWLMLFLFIVFFLYKNRFNSEENLEPQTETWVQLDAKINNNIQSWSITTWESSVWFNIWK